MVFYQGYEPHTMNIVYVEEQQNSVKALQKYCNCTKTHATWIVGPYKKCQNKCHKMYAGFENIRKTGNHQLAQNEKTPSILWIWAVRPACSGKVWFSVRIEKVDCNGRVLKRR